jgi:hypothetical protein
MAGPKGQSVASFETTCDHFVTMALERRVVKSQGSNAKPYQTKLRDEYADVAQG